jgi:hypothetical protein
MKHLIRHDLDPATAKKVTDRAFEEYKNRYPSYKPSLRWVSDERADIGINAKGVQLDGSMTIEKASIAIELDVPFLFRPFKKVAIEVIEREVKVWIGKARAGEI